MQIKLIILLILIVTVNINGQKWNIINKNEITDKGIKDIIPDKFTLYTLDDEVMKSLLWSAPSESGTEVNRSNTFINIGLPDEVQEIFRIVRYDMMEPELAAKFPDIRTFYGIAVSNPLKSVRIDYTIQGFRAVVNSPEDGKYLSTTISETIKIRASFIIKMTIQMHLHGDVALQTNILTVKDLHLVVRE